MKMSTELRMIARAQKAEMQREAELAQELQDSGYDFEESSESFDQLNFELVDYTSLR